MPRFQVTVLIACLLLGSALGQGLLSGLLPDGNPSIGAALLGNGPIGAGLQGNGPIGSVLQGNGPIGSVLQGNGPVASALRRFTTGQGAISDSTTGQDAAVGPNAADALSTLGPMLSGIRDVFQAQPGTGGLSQMNTPILDRILAMSAPPAPDVTDDAASNDAATSSADVDNSTPAMDTQTGFRMPVLERILAMGGPPAAENPDAQPEQTRAADSSTAGQAGSAAADSLPFGNGQLLQLAQDFLSAASNVTAKSTCPVSPASAQLDFSSLATSCNASSGDSFCGSCVCALLGVFLPAVKAAGLNASTFNISTAQTIIDDCTSDFAVQMVLGGLQPEVLTQAQACNLSASPCVMDSLTAAANSSATTLDSTARSSTSTSDNPADSVVAFALPPKLPGTAVNATQTGNVTKAVPGSGTSAGGSIDTYYSYDDPELQTLANNVKADLGAAVAGQNANRSTMGSPRVVAVQYEPNSRTVLATLSVSPDSLNKSQLIYAVFSSDAVQSAVEQIYDAKTYDQLQQLAANATQWDSMLTQVPNNYTTTLVNPVNVTTIITDVLMAEQAAETGAPIPPTTASNTSNVALPASLPAPAATNDTAVPSTPPAAATPLAPTVVPPTAENTTTAVGQNTTLPAAVAPANPTDAVIVPAPTAVLPPTISQEGAASAEGSSPAPPSKGRKNGGSIRESLSGYVMFIVGASAVLLHCWL